jgi:hypothetical protein
MRRASSLLSPSFPCELPNCLKAGELKDTKINKLAAIKKILWLLQQQQLPLSEAALEVPLESLGSTVNKKQLMPTSISLLKLTELLPL